MDTSRNPTHQSQNEDNFPTFSLGLEVLNEAEREKNNRKGDSASAPSRFASLSEGATNFDRSDTLVKPNKWKTVWCVSTFKGRPKFFRFKTVKTRAFNRKFEIKPIPNLLNVSLNANSHFWYCRPFFASDLMHNSTVGYDDASFVLSKLPPCSITRLCTLKREPNDCFGFGSWLIFMHLVLFSSFVARSLFLRSLPSDCQLVYL